MPRSHVEIAELLRSKPDVYRNRIGTYDVRASGIGYLLAFHDALRAPTTYGRLLESFSRADVVARRAATPQSANVCFWSFRITFMISSVSIILRCKLRSRL